MAKDIKGKKKYEEDESEELIEEENDDFEDEDEDYEEEIEDQIDDKELDDEIFNDEDLEENNYKKSFSGEEPSKFSKILEVFKDKKKLAMIFFILIFFFVGIYFLFFRKTEKNEGQKPEKTQETQEKETNPYRINENVLSELPEIKTKPKREPEEKKEIVNELLKNNDLLSLKLDSELKIPEKKPEQKIEIPQPPKIEEKINPPVPLPFPVPPKENVQQKAPLPYPVVQNQTPNQPNIIQDESMQRKINANVIVFAGSGDSKTSDSDKKNTKKTSFPSISESYVGKKNQTILAGKIIDLVLETAINTEQEGIVRAIISSDVYSESGFNILIPAGSRVLGKYAPVLKYGNFRVNVMFNRIVRPDGIDIMLGDMKAINKLGASGIRADYVDNRLGSAFGNSVLIGALSLATLFASQEVEDIGNSSNNRKPQQNQNSGGGTQISINIPGIGTAPNNNNNNSDANNNDYGSATRDIINDAIDPLKKHIEKMQSAQQTPILKVNPGRTISIMTEKDIIFSEENAYNYYPEEDDE